MLSPRAARVAAASINQTVGDWDGNLARILEVIHAARDQQVQLLVLPEMCLPGYSLGDRLTRRGTLSRSWDMLRRIEPHTAGLAVCVGLPVEHGGVLYNAIAVICDRQTVGLVCKEYLATGDVQYENRWFQSWPHGRVDDFRCPDGGTVPMGTIVFEATGLGRFAIEVCEDGWKGIRPGSTYTLAGAEIVCNPSASWFVIGKHAQRRRMVEQISQEDHCCYLYTSLLGCDSTRLVFDGSVLIGVDGVIQGEGRRLMFHEEWELVTEIIDLERLRLARMEEGSWREQVAAFERGDHGPQPTRVMLEGDLSRDLAPRAAPAYWAVPLHPPADASLTWLTETGLTGEHTPADIPHLELELAIALGLHDYTRKSGIRSLTIALSGGRDSAMVAVLVRQMVRYANPGLSADELHAEVGRRLITAYMATANSGLITENAAAGLASELGSKHLYSEIQAAVDEHTRLAGEMVGTELNWTDHDIPMQNVQARLRGSLIWYIANLHNSLLLATSNKSEAAVGYTTMDGDTSGGISPIADVPKSLVSLWLRWARRFHELDSLDAVIVQQPTAELRPKEQEQTDEADLMPFVVLDRLMFQFVQCAQDPLEMFQALWPELSDRYGGDPRAFAAHVEKFVKLFCRAQWKRERFAISFRVTAFDLDPKTGFRFPPVQAPFTAELADLRAYVETLVTS
ncbi:MAG: NAD(+) synthase [Proteobacteria bacterium]|nr:NAD(+) synthase [Pseudomonadota bacterium]MCP4920920.1 NAD(+) synthase [Pseudomonadota bacterium]